MESIYNELSTHQDYPIKNKDVEVQGKYFDLVPDGNLYTLDDYPIFAVRMRPAGIRHIMSVYEKKYKIECKVLTYKINSNQYTLYTSDARGMYEDQSEQIINFFDFESCKNDVFKGIIIVITNKDDRMIHAIPFLYGVVNGRKKIIFLDAFFSPDLGSGCIVGADFFYNAYNGDIDCYCHGDNIQADHHSCGIIACDFVKNCLKNRFSLAKRIINNPVAKTSVENYEQGRASSVYIFSLPNELKKFSQIKQDKIREQVLDNCKDEIEKKKHKSWFFSHMHKLLYRRDVEPYNPEGSVIPNNEGNVKEINTSLLEKGHKYAKLITADVNDGYDYNYKYWISLIREQKDRMGFFRRLLRFTKNFKSHNQQNDKLEY